MKLFEDTCELSKDGVRIQEEFEELIKPFFKKYGPITNPIEFDWLINQALSMAQCSNYIERVTNFNIKN